MTDTTIVTAANAPAGRWGGHSISWSAVIAGALAAMGLSIVLIVLGAAFGFGSMSPFAEDGLSATTIGVVTIIWLILTQIFASAAGGYLAGRVRLRWAIHRDEVFFRDTVHGLLTWAVATIFMFAIAGIAAGGGAAAVTAVTSAAVAGDDASEGPGDMITDRLYRAPGLTPDGPRGEAQRLVLLALADEEAVTAEDRAWLARDVAERTAIPATEAEARVQTAFSQIAVAREEAREQVDMARAASATLAIATALAMMIGAFVACLASVFGGRERDGLEDKLIA